MFYIYKGTFSIVLFAAVDAHYNVTYADLDCQNHMSDGGAFKQRRFSKRMEQSPAEHFTQKNIGSSIRICGQRCICLVSEYGKTFC